MKDDNFREIIEQILKEKLSVDNGISVSCDAPGECCDYNYSIEGFKEAVPAIVEAIQGIMPAKERILETGEPFTEQWENGYVAGWNGFREAILTKIKL